MQIKAILSAQRKQMEEDSKWLAQNEVHWNKNRFDSLNSAKSSELNDIQYCSEQDSTTTSVYEDADCGGGRSDELLTGSLRQHSSQSLNKSDQHLYSKSAILFLFLPFSNNLNRLTGVPNLSSAARKRLNRVSYGDESYNSNSFKSTTSSHVMAIANSNNSSSHSEHTPSTSSMDSNEYCGLSVSLKKFFKHNQLSDAKVRLEMMKQVNYGSADIDRSEDTIYWGTIHVVNSVRQLLKGVNEVNISEYVDLVKVSMTQSQARLDV